MTPLYLAWQHPPTRRWFPVGRLVRHQPPDVFEFDAVSEWGCRVGRHAALAMAVCRAAAEFDGRLRS